jgi:hypothetical protein
MKAKKKFATKKKSNEKAKRTNLERQNEWPNG